MWIHARTFVCPFILVWLFFSAHGELICSDVVDLVGGFCPADLLLFVVSRLSSLAPLCGTSATPCCIRLHMLFAALGQFYFVFRVGFGSNFDEVAAACILSGVFLKTFYLARFSATVVQKHGRRQSMYGEVYDRNIHTDVFVNSMYFVHMSWIISCFDIV